MTTKTKNGTSEASRISKLQSAYRKHQPAIQAALEARRRALAAAEIVTLRNGVQIVIRHGSQGYQVAGVKS